MGYKLRPGIIVALLGLGLFMAYVGLAPNPRPFNGLNEKRFLRIAGDHWLHFLSFTLLSTLLPFITEPVLGLWLSSLVCMTASVLSETVQGMFPWKRFDWWDIVANLVGTALGTSLAISVINTRKHQPQTHQAVPLQELV